MCMNTTIYIHSLRIGIKEVMANVSWKDSFFIFKFNMMVRCHLEDYEECVFNSLAHSDASSIVHGILGLEKLTFDLS